jgi:hypothetical protein
MIALTAAMECGTCFDGLLVYIAVVRNARKWVDVVCKADHG